MKKIISWIAGIFDKDSTVSSKRVVGVIMVIWSLLAASFIIWAEMYKETKPSMSVTLIEFMVVTATGLLAGGSAIELFSKKKKDE
jgi:cobalamin biosynthesis protein CobD/CbiB